MSLLGKVLAGVGGYLVEQGKFQQEVALEQMKADILANRELALKQVDAQIADKAAVRDQTNKLEVVDRTAADQQQTDLVQGVIASHKASAEAAQKHAYDQQDIVLKGDIDAKLEKMRISGDLTKAQVESALATQQALTVAGATVDHVVISPLGEVGFFSKTGHELTQTKPGTTAPPKIDDGSDGLGALLGGGAGGGSGMSADQLHARNAATGGGIAPEGSTYAGASANPSSFNPSDTAPPAADDPAAKAAFGVRYNAATPATAPNLFRNGQKIPIQEAWQMYSGQ